MATKFENRLQILLEFQEEFEEDMRFRDFILQRNIGFPIAYLISNDLVKTPTAEGKKWVNDCFEDLLELFGLKDTNWGDWFEIQEAVGVEADYDLPEGSVWEPINSTSEPESGGAAKFCSECGNEVAGGKFCSGCGTKL